MSYLVLARKSRPQNFEQVVGQEPVVKTLMNSLARNRVAHALLFSGVRGVGKTTLARIMAKALNCTSEDGDKPCCTCQSCTDIANGNALDLVEIDGASNRGIQEIRELKEKLKYLPTSSRYKIIIIDEVHMLTTEAFNALLKTLEEPPEHVYFMFATTEIHKLPITILSRCQRYELKRVVSSQLFNHFNNLCISEGVTIEPSALNIIVRESEGSVRDGLSLLDQVLSYGEEEITKDDVTEVLGLIDRDILSKLSLALLTGDREQAITSLDSIFTFGVDLKRFSGDLLDFFRSLILCKLKGCNSLLDLPVEEIHSLTELSGKFSLETLHNKLRLLMKGVDQLRFTNQPRLFLETTFLSMIEVENIVSIPTILDKLDQTLAALPVETAPPPRPPINSQEKKNSSTITPDKKTDSEAVNKKDPASVSLLHDDAKAVKTEISPARPSVSASSDSASKEKQQNTVPAEEKPYTTPNSAPVPPATPHKHTSTTKIEREDIPPPEEPPHFAQQESCKTVEDSTPLNAIQDDGNRNPVSTKAKPDTAAQQRDVRRDWSEFIEYVKDHSIWMSQDLKRAVKAVEKDDFINLHYQDPTVCVLLKQPENHRLLTEFVLDFFQKELKVRFILPDEENTPEDENSETPNKQRQLLANDPLTIMATEIFNGQVGDIRVGPRSR